MNQFAMANPTDTRFPDKGHNKATFTSEPVQHVISYMSFIFTIVPVQHEISYMSFKFTIVPMQHVISYMSDIDGKVVEKMK